MRTASMAASLARLRGKLYLEIPTCAAALDATKSCTAETAQIRQDKQL
jgi:hypothetical protein